jgi:hypothetical protein
MADTENGIICFGQEKTNKLHITDDENANYTKV